MRYKIAHAVAKAGEYAEARDGIGENVGAEAVVVDANVIASAAANEVEGVTRAEDARAHKMAVEGRQCGNTVRCEENECRTRQAARKYPGWAVSLWYTR